MALNGGNSAGNDRRTDARGRGRRAVIPMVLVGMLALTGCAGASASTPGPSVSTATPTSEPAAALSPLTCDDVVSAQDVTAALTGADAIAPTPEAAIYPSPSLRDHATTPAGGLLCSWRAGAPADDPLMVSRGAHWAYLTLRIVPGAGGPLADEHREQGPFTMTTDVAGFEVGTQCGDPGCSISASIGRTWVQVVLTVAHFGTGDSRLDGLPTDEVLRHMEKAVGSALTAVSQARPAQLEWPALAPQLREPACGPELTSQGVARALGLTEVKYELTEFPDEQFAAYAPHAVGLFTCTVTNGPANATSITVGRNLAATVNALAGQPDMTTGLKHVTLDGSVKGEHAMLACADAGGYCSLLFSLNGSAYQVESRADVVAVAEAIIAQSR